MGMVSPAGLTMSEPPRSHFQAGTAAPGGRQAGDRRAGGRRAARSRGAILVGVLWVLVFLAFLAVVLRLHMTGVVASVRVTEDKAAARIVADAGLARAAALVLAGPEGGIGELLDQLQGSVETSTGRASLYMTNEALRVDVNTADEALVVGVLRASGATPAQAAALASRIVERRGTQEVEEDGAPGRSLTQRADAFQSVAELALVEGMPAELALAMERFSTVSSGLPGVRLHALDLGLLNAIPGIPAPVVAAIEAARAGRLSRDELLALLASVEYHTSEKAISWRVRMEVELPSGYRETYEALVTISPEDDVAYRVIDWRRIADGSVAQ